MATKDERWKHVDAIFSEALDVPRSQWREFVRKRAAGDTDLERSVLELLEASTDEDFLGPLVGSETLASVLADAADSGRETTSSPDPLIGETLGSYRIVRAIGHGGMGSVYFAEREGSFEHHVAIKTLKRGIDTDEVVQRFLAERQILAQLQHPNIARLFDGGVTPDGRPYFVMEWVQGQSVTEHADAHKLGISARLELVKTIAGALQHAHQHLVIHRDLKPSNVLVTQGGVVKLLDFGIARVIGEERQDWSLRTTPAFRVFTPEYAAPEQVARSAITTATDVYQLGVLTYELLSGARPFPSELTGGALETSILDVDPEPPSSAVVRADSSAPHDRGFPTARALADALRGDLDVILSKALSKEPARRYGSVDAFAADLDRFLTGQPISARSATWRYRLNRFARRNRWFVPTTAAAALALCVYVESSIRHNRELTAERNVARSEAERAAVVTDFVTDLLSSPNPWAGGRHPGLTVLEALSEGATRIEVEFAGQPRLQAQLFGTIGSSYYWLARYDEAESVQRRSVELWDEVAGATSLEAMAARSALGRTLLSTQGLESASAVLDPLLAMLDDVPGASDDDIRELRVEVLGNLARVQREESNLDSAFVLYDQAQETLATLDEPNPIRQAEILREHSRTLSIGDRRQEALDLSAQAVELLEGALPADHIELAAARRHLGYALSQPGGGRHAEAVEQLDLALAVFTQRLEPDDPRVLDLRYDKAYALLGLGNLEDAEAEYRALVPLYRQLDPDSESYANTVQDLAATLKRMGDLDEAIHFSQLAHELYERVLGSHYKTAYPLLTIAEVELGRGRYNEGRELASEAYEILKDALPEGHSSTWVALCRRGWGRWGSGQVNDGLADMRMASAALDASSFGPEHPYPLECRQALQGAEASG